MLNKNKPDANWLPDDADRRDTGLNYIEQLGISSNAVGGGDTSPWHAGKRPKARDSTTLKWFFPNALSFIFISLITLTWCAQHNFSPWMNCGPKSHPGLWPYISSAHPGSGEEVAGTWPELVAEEESIGHSLLHCLCRSHCHCWWLHHC